MKRNIERIKFLWWKRLMQEVIEFTLIPPNPHQIKVWNQSFFMCTLLKPKRHSFRCHDFMVHALPLRMCTNVVDFRVMRRLCLREWNWLWNWLCVNQHSWDPWQRTSDQGVWRLPLTAYYIKQCSKAYIA